VRGLPGSSAYSASKAAAMKYLEALRVEMRPRGVAVVTIAPAYIRTRDDRAQSVSDALFDGRQCFAAQKWPMRSQGKVSFATCSRGRCA
jgi:NAD(P)-dependent dehydrogenase (short-subunit alcohol dehydrogenase family)